MEILWIDFPLSQVLCPHPRITRLSLVCTIKVWQLAVIVHTRVDVYLGLTLDKFVREYNTSTNNHYVLHIPTHTHVHVHAVAVIFAIHTLRHMYVHVHVCICKYTQRSQLAVHKLNLGEIQSRRSSLIEHP